MAVKWSYYNNFDRVNELYLPSRGEGETKATQIVTAVNKLVYKYYNDGDVFDNTMFPELYGNDLTDYANWIYKHTKKDAQGILDGIYNCYIDSDYQDLL